MNIPIPPSTYWQEKLSAFLCQALKAMIPNAPNKQAELLHQFGLTPPAAKAFRLASDLAKGWDQNALPSEESEKSPGLQEMILTHPTGLATPLRVNLPQSARDQGREQELLDLAKSLLDQISQDMGGAWNKGHFAGKGEDKEIPASFEQARLLYAQLLLRNRLADCKESKLGALVHRLPADGRMPDHSLWHQSAMTSALYSSLGPQADPAGLGLLVFSITPVQAFISNARKLRDFWSGSILLSWLGFEGCRWIMEHLGPDHILYPSLYDQPLVLEYLRQNWHLHKGGSAQQDDLTKGLPVSQQIATFPNKFLALVPMGQVSEIASALTSHIEATWLGLGQQVAESLCEELNLKGGERDFLHGQFREQLGNYWEYQWAACQWLDGAQKSKWGSWVSQSTQKIPLEAAAAFQTLAGSTESHHTMGVLYPCTHSLLQSALAATKAARRCRRAPQPGEKCHLCGEFQILHRTPWDPTRTPEASAFKAETDAFWQAIREKDSGETNTGLWGSREKLCALCTTKRLSSIALVASKNHLLHATFAEKGHSRAFPSTSEIALHSFFHRQGMADRDSRKKMAQRMHTSSTPLNDEGLPRIKGLRTEDAYYAILKLDGDRMGDLINGATIAAKWQDILHPSLLKRLKAGADAYSRTWHPLLDCPRTLSSATHAAISESLGDFALYGVGPIISAHKGCLIYAGGDDVCAVLPHCHALQAAREINNYYHRTFSLISKGLKGIQSQEILESPWVPQPGKLSVNLGRGPGISLSGAILICHHKENLKDMLAEAEHLLKEEAKGNGGRNALTLALRKRSGGTRLFTAKWGGEAWHSFDEVAKELGREEEGLSSSLCYRLEHLRVGFDAITETSDPQLAQRRRRAFIAKQLESISWNRNRGPFEELAGHIERLVNGGQQNKGPITQALIVAGFTGRIAQGVQP